MPSPWTPPPGGRASCWTGASRAEGARGARLPLRDEERSGQARGEGGARERRAPGRAVRGVLRERRTSVPAVVGTIGAAVAGAAGAPAEVACTRGKAQRSKWQA